MLRNVFVACIVPFLGAALHGTTYYFCSKGCKDKFEKEPERYLASNH